MKKLFFFIVIACSFAKVIGQNVGIGTPTPVDKLSVETTVQGYGITHAFGAVKIGTYLTALDAQFGTRSNHPLHFFTNNGSPQITLLQNGNTGIGLVSPTARLDIAGNVISEGSVAGFRFNDRADNTKGYQWYSTSGNAYLYRVQSPVGNVISILGSGSIGFNTSTPQADLHIDPGGPGSILVGTNKNSGGYTNLEMGISAQSSGYAYLQSTEASGSTYGNLYLNPNGGNVGINTSLATFPLDIVQSGDGATDAEAKAIRIRSTNGGNNYNWTMHGYAHLVYSMNGTVKGYVSYIDGSWNELSDLRYKKDINKMGNVLDRVMSLEPKTYHYKVQKENERLCTGFIAQEVMPLFPEFVNSIGEKDSTGEAVHYGINYAGFSVVAIKAIQEQQQQIETSNEKIKTMMEVIEKMQEEIETLKQKIK